MPGLHFQALSGVGIAIPFPSSPTFPYPAPLPPLQSQVGHFLSLISTFIAGFAVGFARVWPIAAVGVVAIPLILFPGLLYSSILHSLSSKGTQSYSTAGQNDGFLPATSASWMLL